MGSELDLMRDYPKSKNRLQKRPEISDLDRKIARQFSKDYFDGDRRFGYGGYNYHEKYWLKTVVNFITHYNLKSDANILDVGCGKGFMLKDFKSLLPKANLTGLDISSYAIEKAEPEVRNLLIQGNANELPFPDQSFDLVISINTIHNLDKQNCLRALSEIERVSNGNSFIMVDGWENEHDRVDLNSWVLTAQTVLQVEEWEKLFKLAGYSGDYQFWTVNS